VKVIGAKANHYHIRYRNIEGDMHWSELNGASPPGSAAGLLSRVLKRKSGAPIGQAAFTTAQAYARTADPDSAWCVSHGGFDKTQMIDDPVYGTAADNVSDQSNGRVPLTEKYVVCKDATWIQE
jgi:hypothetical protein